ncbi:MAG TPA: hypothetical protein VHW45_17905 [Candidatus Sulfotelmatobacter sp.]|nr:hypothetical protein [Candidatus Sulfotelmatobacter sp.]
MIGLAGNMREYFESILNEPWKPASRPALIAWLVFYLGFLAYAFNAHGAGLIIDSANLVVHEGGHNLFGWFGPTLGLYGGTLLQWLVPFLLAAYFFSQRQVTGFVFSLFFFFENWLYTATYMADARAQVLPLVTTGDPDFVEHDFHAIFSGLGVLQYDTKIAALVRILGWCGMIGCVLWLASRLRAQETPAVTATFPKPAISLLQRYPGKPGTSPSPQAGSNRETQIPLFQSGVATNKPSAESRKGSSTTVPNPQ